MTGSNGRITALSCYVPTKKLTNDELANMVETNDEWITQRTGIKERRIAEPEEYTSDLSIKAVQKLKDEWNKELHDVDYIIVATITPDYGFPSVAAQIQQAFSIKQCGAIDINAACAGFVYRLHLASQLVSSDQLKKVLVVAAESLSKIVDYTDRSTCILFGDGAGAALVEYDPKQAGIKSSYFLTEGVGGRHLYRSGLSATMAGESIVNNSCLVQNGREVYKWAVKAVPEGIQQLLDKEKMTLDNMDWFVPHNANLRMIESICEKSGIPLEKTLQCLEEYGNTSSASIPLALNKALEAGKIKNGDQLLLYGFGGGLVQAGLIITWHM